MHLDLILDTVQAELNSITKVRQKYLDKTCLILPFWAGPALQAGPSLLLSWKTIQLFVVEDKIAASQLIGLSCHEFTRPPSNSNSFHLLAD